MTDIHEVTICGVRFSGSDGPLSFSQIQGWYSGPAVRGEGDVIPSAHGRYRRVELWRDSPLITVVARIEHFRHEDTVSEINRIVNALTGQGEMRVLDETGVWTRWVEIQRVGVSEVGGVPGADITIDLIAPDPVRYRDASVVGPVGLPVREGGLMLPAALPWDLGTRTRPAVTVENTGKVPTLPVVRVQGAASSIVVHGGPRQVEYGPFDGVLVVDSRQRRAWVNGSDITRGLLRRDWHQVAAGESQDFYFTATGADPDTELTVEYQIGVW